MRAKLRDNCLRPINPQYCINQQNLENEKYFNFFKMDKKNVQNWIAKNTLTDEKFRLDKEKLWCHFKPEKIILL